MVIVEVLFILKLHKRPPLTKGKCPQLKHLLVNFQVTKTSPTSENFPVPKLYHP